MSSLPMSEFVYAYRGNREGASKLLILDYSKAAAVLRPALPDYMLVSEKITELRKQKTYMPHQIDLMWLNSSALDFLRFKKQ